MLKTARWYGSWLLGMAAFAIACGGDGGGAGGSGAPGSSVVSSFLTSTSGTSDITVGDTIQYEVTITTIPGQDYDAVLWSLTGDATAVSSSSAPTWAGVSHNVTNWAWNYSPAGSGTVKMGTNGVITPFAPTRSTPGRVAGFYGFVIGQNISAAKTGDGIPALVGTVTITANATGISFQGGGFQIPGFDGFLNGSVDDPPTVSLGAFNVAP